MVLGSFGIGAHGCGTSQHRSNDPAFISFVILPDLTDQDLEKLALRRSVPKWPNVIKRLF
jgi:hypothetical protein